MMKFAELAPELPLPDLADVDQEPAIAQWSVAGHDRLVGKVYGRPGSAEGNTIITSPVLQVRFVGDRSLPVAFTASGGLYRLGTPAAAFGAGRAQQFLLAKSLPGAKGDDDARDPKLRTSLLKLQD